MMVWVVSSHNLMIEKITMKYFTVGHSFMRKRNEKHGYNVYDFSDFMQCVSNAGDVLLMTHSDFYQFESGLSEGKTSKSSRPLLRDVSVAEFRSNIFPTHPQM